MLKPKKHEISSALKHKQWYQDEESESTPDEEPSPLQIDDKPCAGQICDADDQRRSGIQSRRPSIRPGDKTAGIPASMEDTQRLYYLPVKETGMVNLVRIQDQDSYDFRIQHNRPVIVSECPSEGFLFDKNGKSDSKPTSDLQMRCVGDQDVVDMQVRGAGSLSVRWRVTKRGAAPQEHLVQNIIPETTCADGVACSAISSSSEADKALMIPNAQFSAVPHSHIVSLPISHTESGTFDVELHTIEDALHNIYHPDTVHAKQSFQVQRLPAARFALNQELQHTGENVLVKENATVALHIYIDKDDSAGRAIVQLEYVPDPEDVGSESFKETLQVDGKRYDHRVSRPGTYHIRGVEAGHCKSRSDVLSSVHVKRVPSPTAQVDVTSVHDW